MRAFVVVGMSSLVLLAGMAPSEARGFRFRFGGSPRLSAPRPSSAIPGLAVIPSFSLRGDSARGESMPAEVRPVGVMTAEALPSGGGAEPAVAMPEPAAAPTPVKKPAEPWCRTGRVAGSGAGFCLIN